MIKLFLTTTILFFSMLHPAQQNNQRDIWLFAANAGNASFTAQKSILAKDAAGLKERDIWKHPN